MATVSVIIPVYNGEGVIKRAIDSVCAQSFGDIEVIVADDGSTDNTGKVVEAISDERIRYIRCKTNCGPSAARNKGLEVAQGKYIAFLDSDDEWLPRKIEKQVALMESLPEKWGVCHTGAHIIKDGNTRTIFTPARETNGELFRKFVFGKLSFLTPTLMLRKTCIENAGFFDERLRYGEDIELLLRIFRSYKLAVINEPLAVIHMITTKNRTNHIESSWLSILADHESIIRDTLGLYSWRRFRAVIFQRIADAKLCGRKRGDGLNYLVRSLALNPFMTPKEYLRFFLLVSGLLNTFKSWAKRLNITV